MFINELFNESVNSAAFRRGFERQKKFGRYTLIATPGRFLLHQKFNEPSDQFTISVFYRGHKVGWVNFEIVDDNLEALDLYVEPRHRRRGLATAMYKFAVELGNDVKPSGKQTALGRAFWATKDPTTESYEDENTDLPSVEQAKAAIPQILQAAQRVYNDWDEEDRDTYAGGGICHIIADAVCDVLYSAGIECTPVSCDYEQHVYVAAKFEEGIYTIDIPYHIYETGGGFSWEKIPDVVFEKNDVVFYRASGDPSDWGNYINETTEDKTYFEAKRRRKKTRRRVYAPVMYGWYGFPTGDSEGGGDGGMAERKLIKTGEREFINEFGFPLSPGYFRVGDIIAAKDRYGDQFTGQILDISVRPSGKVRELEVAEIKILSRDGEKIDYDSYISMQTFPLDPDIKLIKRGSRSQQDVAEAEQAKQNQSAASIHESTRKGIKMTHKQSIDMSQQIDEKVDLSRIKKSAGLLNEGELQKSTYDQSNTTDKIKLNTVKSAIRQFIYGVEDQIEDPLYTIFGIQKVRNMTHAVRQGLLNAIYSLNDLRQLEQPRKLLLDPNPYIKGDFKKEQGESDAEWAARAQEVIGDISRNFEEILDPLYQVFDQHNARELMNPLRIGLMTMASEIASVRNQVYK